MVLKESKCKGCPLPDYELLKWKDKALFCSAYVTDDSRGTSSFLLTDFSLTRMSTGFDTLSVQVFWCISKVQPSQNFNSGLMLVRLVLKPLYYQP